MTPAECRDHSADLYARLVAYWHDVDFNWGKAAADYYTDDALFQVMNGSNPYRGRAEIAAFYAFREDRGPRVVVHAIHNFMATFDGEDRAEGRWICMIYAQDGEAPQPSAPPIAISRIEDSYRRENGEWLVASRIWHPLFRGGVKGTHASAEEIAKRVAPSA